MGIIIINKSDRWSDREGHVMDFRIQSSHDKWSFTSKREPGSIAIFWLSLSTTWLNSLLIINHELLIRLTIMNHELLNAPSPNTIDPSADVIVYTGPNGAAPWHT